MTSDPKRIVQIIPATGWSAHYSAPGGNGLDSSPLVAWALLANGEVRALDSDQHGITDFADEQANFVRIEASND